MTWREFIRGLIRTFILNSETNTLFTEWSTTGLSTADETVIDAALDTVKP